MSEFSKIDEKKPSANDSCEIIFAKRERRWLIFVSVAVLLLANLPSLLGFIFPPVGTHYSGIDSICAWDLNVYRSYLEQYFQGHLIFKDLFTSEPHSALIFSPIWIVLGIFGQVLGLSSTSTYFVSRIVLGAVLLWLIYFLAAAIFEDVRTRRLTFLIASLGAGVGALVGPVMTVLTGRELLSPQPMDLWVSEAFTFLSLNHSPHFIAATILILLSIAFLGRTLERGSATDAALAGLSMLFLFSFHPFHVLSLGMTTVGFVVLVLCRHNPPVLLFIKHAVLAWLIASPALIYQAWIIMGDPLGSARAAQNILWTPPILVTLASYGFILIFALLGARSCLRAAPLRMQLLVTWAASHALAIYFPLFFNRRVTQGLSVALAFLAAAGIAAALDFLESRRRRPVGKIILGAFLFVSMGLSTAWTVSEDLTYILNLGRQFPYFFYVNDDYVAAFEWLKKNGDENTLVLSSPITGNFIPGWSGRRVAVGHNFETVSYKEREAEVRKFFGEATEAEREELLKTLGVSHVVVGPWERMIGDFKPELSAYLHLAHQSGAISIYYLGVRN